MANVIEQIVQPKNFGSQTIEMTVRSNERGPQGEKGDSGNAATISAGNAYVLEYGQQPQVINSGTSSEAVLDFYIPKGQPGAIHYYAGPGINITDDNRIEATGEMAVYWGDLVGAISNQTDLMNILNGKQNNLTAGANITIAEGIISATDTTYTAGSNVQISGNVISATDTTYTDFIGSTGVASGQAGLVPAPDASANNAILKGDGSWGTVGSNNISNGAITTAKIANNSVTADKIDTSTVIDLFYPVGSYYETSNVDFDPNTAWGGVWVEDAAGRVTVSRDSGTFATVGDTGGNSTFTIEEENFPGFTVIRSDHWRQGAPCDTDIQPYSIGWCNGAIIDSGHLYGKSISNLQPYIVVKRWHRIA